MKHKLILITVLLLIGVQLWAQTNFSWGGEHSGRYRYKYVYGDPMKARFYTLKNGLTVILSVNKKEPRIQTLIGTRAGSNNDPADHTGLAHYLEHLLFKGTQHFGSLDWPKEKPCIDQIEDLYNLYNKTNNPVTRKKIYHQIDSVSGLAAKYAIANEYDKMMTAMGAQGTNAHTAVEETVYEENIPSGALEKYLTVQAERFKDPVFRLFHTELEAVYEEKNRTLDDDRSKVFEALLAGLFPTHNYGQQTTIGTVQHLQNPSLKAIREFYNTYYVPNNMAIVMTGDFDPDIVIGMIDQKFGYMKQRPLKEYRPNAEQPIKDHIEKKVYSATAENLLIGFRTPGAQDPKTALMAEILSDLLWNGKVGLIDLNLNKPQKILGGSAQFVSYKDYGIFFLSGSPAEGQNLGQVRNLLLEQIGKLKNGDFDISLLKAAVNNAKLYRLRIADDNNKRASALMNSFIKSRNQNWTEEVSQIEEMGKVTKTEIMEYARKHLAENYVVVYKQKGAAELVTKVEKPAITPVEVNRIAQSDFVKRVEELPSAPVKPVWMEFDKDIHKSRLGNTDLFYAVNKDNGIFKLYYHFDMGSWQNKRLPLAAEYLQYLGTKSLNSEEVNKAFYNIACNYGVSVANENTFIYLTGLQENFDQAVALFEQLLRECKPDEKILTAIKARILKSRINKKTNKEAIIKGLVSYGIYGAQNPFNYELTNSELERVKADELTGLLHGLNDYTHRIVYYGPEQLATISSKIKSVHQMPGAFKPIPEGIHFLKSDQLQNKVLFADYDMVQSEIYWLRNGGTYDQNLTGTIGLFDNYFGGGMNSVVFQTIRESRALAYSTYAYTKLPENKAGRYTTLAYVGSQADKMNDAINGMNELLNELPESGQSLMAAKQSIKKDLETERITGEKVIFRYLEAQKFGLNRDIRKDVYEAVDKMDFDTVLKYHDSNLKHKPFTYCILASEKKINQQDLEKIGPVTKLGLEEIFGY